MTDQLRVVILCEGNSGMAANCLPALVGNDRVEVVAVVMATPKRRSRMRLVKKVLKIGLLGAVNGIRMRKWYSDGEVDLAADCARLGVPCYRDVLQNSPELVDLLKSLSADLGLSLGNGFISPRVFQVPRYGMINVHSEVLPAYQNAQSIIWPIYCNDPYTGFTIHEIERKIDGGRILFQERVPIDFRRTLEETVRVNRRKVEEMIPAALAQVCAEFHEFRSKAVGQADGHSYTTPSIWQYWRMARNNRRFYGQTH